MNELDSRAVLLGDWNTELTSIECGVARGNVMATDDNGHQIVTSEGSETVIDLENFPGAPDNCPLKTETGARTVERFAACGNCCLSWLRDANGTAHI